MKRSRAVATAALFMITLLGPSLALAGNVDASHELAVDGDTLRVTSRWYGHAPKTGWEFAAPLPPGTRVLNRGAAPVIDPDDHSVVGVSFTEPPPYPLELDLELPWSEHDSTLPLPLPPDPGWQRIEIAGDYRLVVDGDAGLPLHTGGYYGPGKLHGPERLRIDRRLDRRHPAGAAYVPGELLREAGGLPARLESGAARKLGLAVAAGGAFVAGLLVLAVVFRRAAARVEVEDAEAYLDAEYRNLADPSEPA